MIALALLASHLVGDFLFQTRWQANGKLDHPYVRARHVLAYCLAFVWVPFLDVSAWRLVLFGGLLAGLHFLTDSRRFHSTIGDVVGWRTFDEWSRREFWREESRVGETYESQQPVPVEWLRWPTPNPWTALPLMIDQTLHVVQLAALGWLLV